MIPGLYSNRFEKSVLKWAFCRIYTLILKLQVEYEYSVAKQDLACLDMKADLLTLAFSAFC